MLLSLLFGSVDSVKGRAPSWRLDFVSSLRPFVFYLTKLSAAETLRVRFGSDDGHFDTVQTEVSLFQADRLEDLTGFVHKERGSWFVGFCPLSSDELEAARRTVGGRRRRGSSYHENGPYEVDQSTRRRPARRLVPLSPPARDESEPKLCCCCCFFSRAPSRGFSISHLSPRFRVRLHAAPCWPYMMIAAESTKLSCCVTLYQRATAVPPRLKRYFTKS